MVEEDAAISVPFSEALGSAGFATTIAATALEALAFAHHAPPDLVLLELVLAGTDGHEMREQLRELAHAPIVMLTATQAEADHDAWHGNDGGADDYVVKPIHDDDAITLIRAALRRADRAAEALGAIVHVGPIEVDVRLRRARLEGVELPLAPKELELLARLARDAGEVVTRDELMNDVWSAGWFGSTKTLDVHISWLRRKLGDDPGHPRFIETVRGVGFRLGHAG
jgi:DNA-binding response OmpR family regulator